MADILDNYRRTTIITGATVRDRAVFDKNQIFNDTFRSAPEYEQIKVTNDSTNTTNYDSWIYSNSSYKELVSMKTIIFAPGTPENIVFSGQYIRPQRQGGLFMMVSDDKQYEDKLKGKIDSCTETLRWYDEDGNLRSYPVVVMNSYRKGLNEDKNMILTNGQYIIGVPQNDETFKLQEGDEFIFNRKHKYRIAGFEDIESSTFMTITLDKYEENREVDDVQNGIANFANRPRFTISSSISNSQLTIGNDVQLDVTLLDKDGQVSNKPLTYSTSDSAICTVSDSGLITPIALGSCTIKAEMTNNSNVSSEIAIEVVAVPVDSFTYVLSPDVSSIFRLGDILFDVQGQNNAVDISETYTFNFVKNVSDDDRLIVSTVDSDTFSVRNTGTSGSLEVEITPVGRPQDVFVKTFNISGAYG